MSNDLSEFNVTINDGTYNLNISFEGLGVNLKKAQMALDAQVWADVQKYMPLQSGALKSETAVLNASAVGSGKVYLYPPDSDYGHYQYEGVVYEDPLYHVGAFYNPTYGFWSRPGVEKIRTERALKYSQPNATSHWGETAIMNHRSEWLDLVKGIMT